MITVYKYPICSANFGDSVNTIEVPVRSNFLKLAQQGDQICAWYFVDSECKETKQETWLQFGTGHEMSEEFFDFEYIDSVINGPFGLVWHMFRKIDLKND